MKTILRTDTPRDMYLVKQVGANGSNSVLPGLGTSSQSSLRLQGQQALQYQPAVLYLVGNVSIGMLPKGFGPVHCWQCPNVILQAATSHCLNHNQAQHRFARAAAKLVEHAGQGSGAAVLGAQLSPVWQVLHFCIHTWSL